MAVMSSFKQMCPSCEGMVSVKEGMVGKKIECPKCKDKFIAERPDDEEAEESAPAKQTTKANGKKNTAVTEKTPPPAVKTSTNGKKTKAPSEDDDPRSKTSKSKPHANGKPSQKGRPDDEDEDEDETEGKSKKKKDAAGSKKLVIGLGLAVVGIVILVVAAFFVMNGGGTTGPSPIPMAPGGNPLAGNPGQGAKIDPNKNGGFNPNAAPVPQTAAELAKVSNLLPNDTEHLFHVSMKDLFGDDSSALRKAVFQTAGALNDADLQKNVGFSLLAINDVFGAERNTAPSWRYTVIHFKDVIQEADLKTALKLTPVTLEGETCYTVASPHASFDPLARFSFGIPNYMRYYETARDRPSILHIHNSQTLIVGDQAPVVALLKAKGQFAFLTNRQQPTEPPAGAKPGGGPKTPTPGPGTPMPPMPGGNGVPLPLLPGAKFGVHNQPEKNRLLPGDDQDSANVATSFGPAQEGSGRENEHFAFVQNPAPPPTPGQVPGPGTPPMPGPGAGPATDPLGGPNPGGLPTPGPGPGTKPAANPNPAPTARDEMYMTIKPSLKAIMDRMELPGADGKNRVLFSSATDMDANRVDTGDAKDAVVRRPRQMWDVTILLYEQKPRIRTLGTALIQKEQETLKYQLRNEINCAQKLDADEFQLELMGRTSQQVSKFIQNVIKHEVRLPTPEKKEKAPMNSPPGLLTPGLPDPGLPTPGLPTPGLPTPGLPAQGPAKEDKKPQEVLASRIAVFQRGSTVEFVLDLVLDGPALDQIQAVASLAASAMRVEMEVMGNLSLRHLLATAGKEIGEKGLSQRQVPPGTFPPGTFPRPGDRRNLVLRTDREPQNRISWMAGLLPYLGQQPLFNKLDFQKSWRDPSNWTAGNAIVPQFLDPMYPDQARFLSIRDVPLDFAATHYVGMAGVGRDAASYQRGDPATDHKRGVFGYDGSASLDEIRKGRGLANTIMMIQVPYDPFTGVNPWIAGGGATVRGVPEKNSIAEFILGTDRNGKPISHQNKRGAFVVMTDGSVRFIADTVSDDVFKAMCTVGGPAPADFDLSKNPNTPLIPLPGAKGAEPARTLEEKQPVVKAPVEKQLPPSKIEPEKKPPVPSDLPKPEGKGAAPPKTSRVAPRSMQDVPCRFEIQEVGMRQKSDDLA